MRGEKFLNGFLAPHLGDNPLDFVRGAMGEYRMRVFCLSAVVLAASFGLVT